MVKEIAKPKLRGFFVCDHCAASCEDGEDEVGPYGPHRCPEAYFPRKQEIRCLGPYCDAPCPMRQETGDLTMEHLIRLALYLGAELNKVYCKE